MSSNYTVISQLAAAYQIYPVCIGLPQRGYRNRSYALTLNDAEQLNLIQYKRDADILERIQRANLVGQWAHEQGLPARYPYDPRILKIISRKTTTYAGLYNYLPGNTIPWEAYTQRHLKLLGISLARLHRALMTLPQPNRIQDHQASAELLSQFEQNTAYISDYSVQQSLKQKLRIHINPDWTRSVPGLLKSTSKLSNQQALHLDFVRSNLLFAPATPSDQLHYQNLALTGILDFEKTAWGNPVIDIARTLAFLLVDCRYKSPYQVRKYFLYSGYLKRGLGSLSAASLEPLVDYFLFYDFSKFLKHNPYESLKYNLHFRRTVALLIYRQILSPDDTIKLKQ